MLTTGSDEPERTRIAEATLSQILASLGLQPRWGIAGLGAAEMHTELPGDLRLRITVSIEHPDDNRWSVMQAAIAHRDCSARLDAAERLIECVRARDIGTSGGVGAAFEVYDALASSRSPHATDQPG
jgi:hypothetical protein